jgi:hypothetical protein
LSVNFEKAMTILILLMMNILIGKKTKQSRRKIRFYISLLRPSGSSILFNSIRIYCPKLTSKDHCSSLKIRIKIKSIRVNTLAGSRNCPQKRKSYGF